MNLVGALPRIRGDELAAYAAAGRPAVVEGALEGWPALARWSPDYLAARLGPIEVRCKVSASGAHPNFHASTLREAFATEPCSFAELVTSLPRDASGRRLFTGDEKFVLRRRDGVTTIDPELAPLYDDARVPPWIPPDRLYTVWAWFSGAGVRTWLHYDNNGCDNLNAQITGEKSCIVIDPDQLDRVALFPIGGANPALNCSQVDVAAPDLARFPAFAHVEAWSARLVAGDLLFLPAWWLHAFAHHGAFNANLNFWWKPERASACAVARHQAAIDEAAARAIVS